MTQADQLLDKIEEGIVNHGGDLGGWTRRSEDSLQLFDGRVTLRAQFHPPEEENAGQLGMVHMHVFTTLHEYEDEVLDACIFGMGSEEDAAIAEAAVIWITCVAGPIRSFIDNKPVCMTCQAGVIDGDVSAGYSTGDYGLPNLRAFVGPTISRGFQDDVGVEAQIDDSRPWFRFAAESAAPRRVHLAKSTVLCKGEEGWSRELEIDGHEVSHHDPQWISGVNSASFGYLTRFAVFEFPRNSNQIALRAELDKAIRYFAHNYSRFENIDDLCDEMVGKGFHPDLVHELESFSTIAFGRSLFERHGVKYPPTIIRARLNGDVEMDVPLMSLPAFSRARALCPELLESMSDEDYQSLCFYNAESHAILNALEAEGDNLDLTEMTLFPCVVPDRGVSNAAMTAALAKLDEMVQSNRETPSAPERQSGKQSGTQSGNQIGKKPWWKFW